MNYVCGYTQTKAPNKRLRFILAFCFAVEPKGLWKYKKKGGSKRMNNKPRRRFRVKRNARMKQQILRKERQRETKYPLANIHRQTVYLRQNRGRGA